MTEWDSVAGRDIGMRQVIGTVGMRCAGIPQVTGDMLRVVKEYK